MMVNNNRDVNYLHSLQEKLYYDTLQRKKYLILRQMSCQNIIEIIAICIIN